MILVFTLCIVLRAIPELVAYPHPIGYDVVNYYIPVVANFDIHWHTASTQFPTYVLFLHFVSMITGLPAQSVVVGIAVGMFGVFGVLLFYLGRSLLTLNTSQSMFVALFVIFQMAVLRTAWDLHRDVFALAGMLFVLCMLDRKVTGWKGIALIIGLAALTVAADRMIGVLLCISLTAYAIMNRRAEVIATCILASALFFILMIVSYSASVADIENVAKLSEKTPVFYNPQNLLVLFLVVNGILVVPAVVGFLHMKNNWLKVPLLVSLAGSFSWLALPDISLLVSDRWIILSGVFLSICAGYGILHMVKHLKSRISTALVSSILAAFAAAGLAYAVMPYDNPFILYGLARGSIEDFVPVTMQFNSLDIGDNDKLLSTIAWINHNTEHDAVIVGEKHWRGFMELHLEDDRTYLFSDNPQALYEALEKRGENVYLIRFDGSSATKFTVIEDPDMK
jgi:hypothetical protein